ncbi:Signal transduction histidine kinase [Sinosporangium album]|uniref:histidine kinase n=1 Tax=Sinosporangium album TaxID=504805 RepID=A0A1G7V226_9ACTN|nr:sensor histidine kinase [Sinosporangium album]SDG53872.1 Signal transduction histidine kinase [Sinosporangium album]
MTADTAVAGQPPLRARVPLGPNGPLGLLVDPATWRAASYLVVGLAFGLTWFVFLAAGLSLSLPLIVIWVGVPLALAVMLLWRLAATLHRHLIRLAFGMRIASPYRPRPQGRGVLRWAAWMLGDPATWRDLGYLLLLLPLGLVETVVSLVLWGCVVGLIGAPLFIVFHNKVTLFSGVVIDSWTEALVAVPAGIAVLALTVYGVRGMAWLHTTLGQALLGPDQAQFAERAEHLKVSRARGVDATETERRRIERDLHDGAQQRLLTVAMDLGRAQEKMADDPQAAWELVAQAHLGAKAAIAELRDLARGIYPAILTDRGLDAALSALAARAPVHVDVTVDIVERPPAAVESIAYFIVAECLTNIAKHSRATEASILVGRDGEQVVVEIRDNGVGGAAAQERGGLAGLADRAATIDGILTVSSPPGGPTLVEARLPCQW